MGEQRIGVFGGTFNPVHFGHLHIAERVRKLFGLSRVLFVVSTTPPHKPSDQLISFTHRYAMVGLATAGSPRFEPSMVELSPPASPFSVDTLAKLSRALRNSAKLYFIAGADSILEIATWHRSSKLLTCYNFVFVMRPGVELADPGASLPDSTRSRLCDLRKLGPTHMQRRIGAEAAAAENRIYVVDVGAPDISASRIRDLVSTGRPVHSLVPPLVREYMQKLQLYGDR